MIKETNIISAIFPRIFFVFSILLFIFSLLLLGQSIKGFNENKGISSFKGYKPLNIQKESIPPVFYREYLRISKEENVDITENKGVIRVMSDHKDNYFKFHSALNKIAMVAPATVIDIESLCVGNGCAPILGAELKIYQKSIKGN